jgi:transcriptional regulator with XRE-family HTH domain
MGRPVRGWQVLTEMRVRREVLGWSRQQLAERIDALLPTSHRLTCETVEEWELRERVPRSAYAEALCTLLGAPDIAELGLGHSLKAAAHWCWATQTQGRAYVLHRRTALERTIKLTGLGLLPVPELVQAAQVLGQRPAVYAVMVDEAQTVASRLAATYANQPAHTDIARATQTHARTLTNLLRRASMSPLVRTRLQAVSADACALSGFVALDASRLSEAGLWFDRSLSLAREADDARLQAAALVARSWLDSPTAVGASSHAPRRAIATLRQACATAHLAPPALRVWTHAHLCRDLAGAGDAQGSARALDQAWQALDNMDADGNETGWGWFSRQGELSGWRDVRLQAFCATRMLTLGHLSDGLPLATAVLKQTTNPGRRARLLGDLCAGWARADDPHAACAAGMAALDEADAVGFAAAARHIRAARSRFHPRWNGLTCVTELDERLAALP